MDVEDLSDTNIFLEIILGQRRSDLCKRFLRQKEYRIAISDFSLHSIGVSLFRIGRPAAFVQFLDDITDLVTVLTLDISDYERVVDTHNRLHLDFDDSYQLVVAEKYGLNLITLDSDFRDLNTNVPITILR